MYIKGDFCVILGIHLVIQHYFRNFAAEDTEKNGTIHPSKESKDGIYN